ncbi:MAG: response regulator [Pseudobacter sp.]|uniref:response regulator n=1 Tax=Pseudobacter sp. TaxID=2045420 RepID=UPI003F7E9117
MKTCKILVIDDDREDHVILKDVMETIGAADVMDFAVTGPEALNLLNGHYTDTQLPCLIVMDLNMPMMNGTQALGLLKEDKRFNKIPVIIYSTSLNPFEKEKCMGLGAHSYITKPVTYQDTIETAKIFLGFCKLRGKGSGH